MGSKRKYYFVTIAETRNITRAAELLMVSQPSLTQYLNQLEGRLGIKLLDRSYTPLRLTAAGLLYRDHLQEQRRLEEQFHSALRELRGEGRRPLTIGIPLQKSHALISEVLPSFSTAHPAISVSIWEGTSSTVRQRVVDGELDLGFGHTLSDQDSACVIQPLGREKIVIICNAANPILDGQATSLEQTLRVSPTALNGQWFYQMSPEYFLYEVEAEHMRRHGVDPQKRIVMSNLHAIIDAIIKSPSTGFAYMPDYVLYEHWPSSVRHQLAFLRLDEEDYRWYFSMLRKKNKPMSRDARCFWDCVMETCHSMN